jgi:multimeric flavodoxin WrbA
VRKKIGGQLKIIAINGSAKKSGGVTQQFIDAIFEGARFMGAECETIRLSNYQINRCIACDFCQKSEDYSCIYKDKDDYEKIISKIRDSDIILYSTPVYVLQMSSLMKIFFERIYAHGKSNVREFTKSGLIFHDVDEYLKSKPFVNIIVSDNLEDETTNSIELFFKSYSKFMDSKIVGNILRKSAFIFRDDASNNKYSELKNKVLNALILSGKQLVTQGYISKNTEKAISKSILPIPKYIFTLLKKSEKGKQKLLEKIADS